MRDACKRAGLELKDKPESLLMGLVRGWPTAHLALARQQPQLVGKFIETVWLRSVMVAGA